MRLFKVSIKTIKEYLISQMNNGSSQNKMKNCHNLPAGQWKNSQKKKWSSNLISQNLF